jgi:tRNA nucleotidyltransferase (CCA-adding enzyme)
VGAGHPARVAADVLDALRALPCGERLLAAAAGLDGVWLVGGAVRDLRLGRPPHELDVAVEGPVDALAERLGGEHRAYERFGTASVRTGGCAFDLAATRAESYAHPGALPDVRPAGIEEDLARRDVTVNALAVHLPDGKLLAVEHAEYDLAEGILRVLHERSFVDDPTRLWRVARYAARLGFAVEPRTAALAAAADPSSVSGERIGAEVRLALREPDPFGVFVAAAELNPALLPDGFVPRPGRVQEALALLPEDGRRDLVALAACTAGMDVRALLAWLDRLAFPARDRDIVAAASRASTAAPLHRARTPAEIAVAARGAPVEAVALAGGENARRWIEELRHVRLEISGDDLLAAGVPEGPEVGERLRRALERKLDGEVDGRDAELAAALE